MKSVRLLAGLLCAAAPSLGSAQLPRPHLDWRTAETPHFRFHYPAGAERWTLDLASRMESVSDAVTALVGGGPRGRVTIVVEDPLATSNGSAWPVLDRPAIYLWPTPATAGSSIGHSRGWAEELAVHEFAHVAHLTRPSRNPRQRLFWRLSPIPLGPVARRAPRWAFEGYATYVEGRLTGSGRPYGAARAAALRQWALEGALPKYSQLNGVGGYRGGEMAYLAGSAFFEWLVARTGEESLPRVWRRLSAREKRSFDQAFAGVYGATPAAPAKAWNRDQASRASGQPPDVTICGEWSDGESNPDLLNAIQPSSPGRGVGSPANPLGVRHQTPARFSVEPPVGPAADPEPVLARTAGPVQRTPRGGVAGGPQLRSISEPKDINTAARPPRPVPQPVVSRQPAEPTDAAALLEENGVERAVARQLAAAYPMQRIADVVETMQYRRSRGKCENPGGFIRDALVKQWQTPQAVVDARAKAETRARAEAAQQQARRAEAAHVADVDAEQRKLDQLVDALDDDELELLAVEVLKKYDGNTAVLAVLTRKPARQCRLMKMEIAGLLGRR